MSNLLLILGDQCSPNLPSLLAGNKERDAIVMAEVMEEASYVPHHPKKIVLIFSIMRHFAQSLREQGWTVHYTKLDDPGNTHSITGELVRYAALTKAKGCIATYPGEFVLIDALRACPLPITLLEDTRFIARHKEFETWAKNRKELRMEYFYRMMRRKTGLLMDNDQPVGGQWNFDAENRKSPPKSLTSPGPKRFSPDTITQEVITLVQSHFATSYTKPDPFWFAVTHAQAQEAFVHWLDYGLPKFGDFQDAMVDNQPFLFHAIIGLYLNSGLLDPLTVCQAVEEAYHANKAPLNAVEGFIRQIIGWREYIRGIYFHEGRDYTQRNALNHQRALPDFYWTGKTEMACMRAAITQTLEEGYAHHIQRLMVTGNFALLAGLHPYAVHRWYLSVYVDAYEWVEAPNVIGMSQFADGGIIASKPYISSGNYINKMSNHCKTCRYKVDDKTGPDACPFNLLYWDFLDRHQDRFASNPRMGPMYRLWHAMDPDKQNTIRQESAAFLNSLENS